MRSLSGALLLAVLTFALTACGGSTVPDGVGPPDGPPDGGPGGECAVTIAENITIPTRLANLGDGCDYRVDGTVRIVSSVTIDPGTEIQFGQDSIWHITDTGSLQAVGTQDQHITLRGAVNTIGYWYGLCFGDNRASRLEWVDLLNAGKVWRGASSMCRAGIGHGAGSGEAVDIVDTLVAFAQTTGLDATELNLGEFHRNIFAGNMEYGVRVSVENLQRLDTESDYAGSSVDAPNAKNFVFLGGRLIDTGKTHAWPRLNAPYFIGGDDFDYSSNVIIDESTNVEVGSGTTFVFGPDGGINVWEFSTFTAIGTADQPVVFTGHVPEPGSWDGISALSAAIHLEHAEVSWGGAEGIYAGNVSIAGVSAVQESHIYSSLIKGSATCGIYIGTYAKELVFHDDNNVMEDNAQDVCI